MCIIQYIITLKTSSGKSIFVESLHCQNMESYHKYNGNYYKTVIIKSTITTHSGCYKSCSSHTWVIKSPVHLKTQLWQTVHIHFLKTPRARGKKGKLKWLWIIIIKRRCLSKEGGLDIGWILRQTFLNFPFLLPSLNVPAVLSLLRQFHPHSTADQGQRLWPPTGSVNAAANLRGPRQLFFVHGSWTLVEQTTHHRLPAYGWRKAQ